MDAPVHRVFRLTGDLGEVRRSTSIPRLWVIIPAHRSHGNLAEAGYVVSKNVKWNSGDRMAKPAHYHRG
jgi:hypothetical protein